MRHQGPIASLAFLLAASVTAAAPLAAQRRGTTADGDADTKAVMAYRLTEATFTKLAKVQDEVYAAMKVDTSFAKKYQGPIGAVGHDAAPGIDGMVKALDDIAPLKQAIARAGLTTREYLLASMATMQAVMIDGMMQTYGGDAAAGIPPAIQANIAFVKAHRTEVDRMQARGRDIEQLMRRARGETPGADSSVSSPR